MSLDLARLPPDDDPLDDWTDAPDPEEIAPIVERSYGLADGAVGAAVTGWLAAGTAYVARDDGRPASCLTVIREGPRRGVFLVGTIPESRGRGLARRLLLRALHEARAPAPGLDPAVEQARLPGLPAARVRRAVPSRHVGARALTVPRPRGRRC